jgi:hypothetical protein
MMLPAFKGIDAVAGIARLDATRAAFVLIDANTSATPSTHRDIYAVGVCVAIPPVFVIAYAAIALEHPTQNQQVRLGAGRRGLLWTIYACSAATRTRSASNLANR